MVETQNFASLHIKKGRCNRIGLLIYKRRILTS